MKAKAERATAKQALRGFNTALPQEIPTEGIAHDPPAIKISPADEARIVLREKREGSRRYSAHTELAPASGVNALSFAIRYLPGGRARFLEFVKLAAANGDPSATAWWMVYADLKPAHRRRVSFDDVCEASGVKPSQLLAAVVGHGVEAMTDMGNLVAAAFHPEVIQAMGKSALRIDDEQGAEDRRLFLQGRGFLPTPKGASIHLHANASASAAAAAQSASEPSVPKFAADMEALSSPRDEVQRQITEGEVVDVES